MGFGFGMVYFGEYYPLLTVVAPIPPAVWWVVEAAASNGIIILQAQDT